MSGVDAGVSIYRKGVLGYIPSKYPVSLENEVLHLLIERGELLGWLINERFYDIGTFERLTAARKVIV